MCVCVCVKSFVCIQGIFGSSCNILSLVLSQHLSFMENKTNLNVALIWIGVFFLLFWLHWVFVAVLGLSLVAVIRGYFPDFTFRWLPLCWAQAACAQASAVAVVKPAGGAGGRWLRHMGSVALQRVGSSAAGIEPASPASPGEFLTMGPPGSPEGYFFLFSVS